VKHPEVPIEQGYLDHAYTQARRMRDRAAELAERDDLSAGEVDAAILRAHFSDRAKSLTRALSAALCFGRIDDPESRYYIGHTHIEDEARDTVVIDWRARAAIPFYRATVADCMELTIRRRFILEDRSLVDILEEDFDDPEATIVGAGGVPDPLLAELGRSRTGRMRDIVATIQAEQDEVIRAGVEECLIVQGGPGTGKTAVGLHRAAFLLYEHRERLARERVLVLGPNRLFLDYISQVLPTLGERSVMQATIESLLGRYRVEAVDTAAAAATKADARMAMVIRNAARATIASPATDLEIPFGTRIVRITAKEIDGLADLAAAGDAPWSVRRHNFRNALLRLAYARLPESTRAETDMDTLAADIFSGSARRAIDSYWKTMNPVALVRRVLTSRSALSRAAAGILSEDEQAAILRKPAKSGQRDPWTRFDLALLDEAEALVNGNVARYGHIVVDEAQDRTPMELRLIGRRTIRGSMTILGDLAQATGVAAATDWSTASDHLGVSARPKLVELTVGYRLPAAVLDFANRLLSVAAPGVTAARSVREEGDPPSVLRCSSTDEMVEEAAELAVGFATRYSTSAIIAPGRLLAAITARLSVEDVSWATDFSTSLEVDIAVLSPVAAKGLEFDAVIVVEPTAMIDEEPGAERALFVALTRAVQHLSILHVGELPSALR
jgi:DNA helicase IV